MKMTGKFYALLICCGLIFAATACSSSKKSMTEQTVLDITSLEWRLVSVKAASGELLTPAKDKSLPTLRVTPEGKVFGFGGCNSYTGSAAIKGKSVKFEHPASTMKYCMETMDIENALHNALISSDNYVIENGDLVLKKGDEVLANFSTFR
jgi:Heat shock protein